MAKEIERIQTLQTEQEKQGQEPDPLPDESELKEKISELRARCIKQWKEDKFEEFVQSMRKRQSQEKIDQRAEEFLINNNCTVNKVSRKRIAKLHSSCSNVQSLPSYSRFIAIVNQYFPEVGAEILTMLH